MKSKPTGRKPWLNWGQNWMLISVLRPLNCGLWESFAQSFTYISICLSQWMTIFPNGKSHVLFIIVLPVLITMPGMKRMPSRVEWMDMWMTLLVKQKRWSKLKCPRDVKNHRKKNMMQLLNHHFDSNWEKGSFFKIKHILGSMNYNFLK